MKLLQRQATKKDFFKANTKKENDKFFYNLSLSKKVEILKTIKNIKLFYFL